MGGVPPTTAARAATDSPWHADESTMAVRIGLRYVRNLGDGLLERIEAERTTHGPLRNLEDFARRSGVVFTKIDEQSRRCTPLGFG